MSLHYHKLVTLCFPIWNTYAHGARVRACVRACVCVCARACVRVCVTLNMKFSPVFCNCLNHVNLLDLCNIIGSAQPFATLASADEVLITENQTGDHDNVAALSRVQSAKTRQPSAWSASINQSSAEATRNGVSRCRELISRRIQL